MLTLVAGSKVFITVITKPLIAASLELIRGEVVDRGGIFWWCGVVGLDVFSGEGVWGILGRGGGGQGRAEGRFGATVGGVSGGAIIELFLLECGKTNEVSE